MLYYQPIEVSIPVTEVMSHMIYGSSKCS